MMIVHLVHFGLIQHNENPEQQSFLQDIIDEWALGIDILYELSGVFIRTTRRNSSRT